MPGDPTTQCECAHSRAAHGGNLNLGMCNGCHCSRFVKRTRQFVHIKMMQAALLVAIDVIESLPGEGRTIKIGLPEPDERTMVLKQMKAAIAGPNVEVA